MNKGGRVLREELEAAESQLTDLHEQLEMLRAEQSLRLLLNKFQDMTITIDRSNPIIIGPTASRIVRNALLAHLEAKLLTELEDLKSTFNKEGL